jgi:hypothetical protein
MPRQGAVTLSDLIATTLLVARDAMWPRPHVSSLVPSLTADRHTLSQGLNLS